jgi:hypothetical protein
MQFPDATPSERAGTAPGASGNCMITAGFVGAEVTVG